MTVRETWPETESDLVEAVAASVGELDHAIVDSGGSALGARVLRAMDAWRSSEVEDALSHWQVEVAARFRSNATIRWRRRSTEQMIDRESWKVGVNPSVQVSNRLRRVMRSNLDSVTVQSHDLLISIFSDAIDQRRAEWQATVADAASFKPGVLFVAAQALEEQ